MYIFSSISQVLNPKDINPTNIESYWSKFSSAVSVWLPKIAGALISSIIIYFVGSWLIKGIMKVLQKAFEKSNVEVSLRKFLTNLIRWTLNILLFVIVITQLGIQTSAFVAAIGAAGLAIGLSLQGSLSNFAGGVLILTLKPFRVGDYIESKSGEAGTVKEIDIFNTKLITPQNQLVVVPNGGLSNSSIINYSVLGTRRTWIDIGVAYDANLRTAKELLLETVSKNEYAFKEPAPEIVVTTLGDSAVNLSIRVSTTTENFWKMREQLIISCKEALDNAGISIPFPQQDVHIISKA
ncbi:mechanosensitive ion channel protein [Arachidicoccus ginsenosidimutans]|uniref:mechanosensitive ion channel family protein n=1 Tax=Arachidicoccus sp. BS20 TaxID=1850526 RepID=UPI0007F1529A|nr:mechanosensitive ion channel family protein [Arachidicoccus sp. BS20]ANI88074.1 mechanosensitive ion channel protein [Arachidicoccus sp. BS20]